LTAETALEPLVRHKAAHACFSPVSDLEMSNILITGATGNTGSEVIRFMAKTASSHQLITGVRNIEKKKFEIQ